MASSPMHLDKRLGAVLLGNVIAGILFGCTCMQILSFFRQNKDTRALRGLVLFLWTLDTFHLGFITHASYHYLVSNYGNTLTSASAIWSIVGQLFIIAFNDLIIRGFFARRVWLLTNRNKILLLCIALPAAFSFATGIGAASSAFSTMMFDSFTSISYLFYMSLTAGAVSDLVIAAQLCLCLWRSGASLKKTYSILDVVTMYTINTTFLTSLCSVASLVTFAIWPKHLIWIAIYFVMSKLYLNSFLATLNSRATPSEKNVGVGVTDLDATLYHFEEDSHRRPQLPGQHYGTQTTVSDLDADIADTTLNSEDRLSHELPIWYHHHRVSLNSLDYEKKEQENIPAEKREGRFHMVGLNLPLPTWFKGKFVEHL